MIVSGLTMRFVGTLCPHSGAGSTTLKVTEITAVLEAEREAHCRRVSELKGRHAQESVVLREHVVTLHEELQVCLIPLFRLHG